MDFSWSQEQTAGYDTCLRLTENYFKHHTVKYAEYWTREQWQFCAEQGLTGLCVPTHYGGRDCNALTTAHLLEAFGRGCEDMGLVFSVAAHLLACVRPLVEYGSEDLKETWLPGCCAGQFIAGNAITEKDAGSDVFALKTRAVWDGDAYILTGTKSYVSNGPIADFLLVYAATNPTHGYLGLSAFVVKRDTPGLSIGETCDKMGLTSAPACQVHLRDCRVPLTCRLGSEGQGAQIFTRSMQWERSCLFAAYVGMLERQLEQSVAYARERRQFGKPIGKQQAIAHRLADMKLRLESARLLLYRACWLLDQGKATTQDISLAKLAVSEAALQGGLDAIQIHGALGFEKSYGIERMLRDAIPGSIFSGTSEIHRNIIANELGL